MFRFEVSVIILVHDFTRMDILVLGSSLDNGECGFWEYDGVINEGGCLVCFPTNFLLNMLASDLIYICQQSNWSVCIHQFSAKFPQLTMPRTFKERNIPCATCGRQFTNRAGLTNHQRIHRRPSVNRVHRASSSSRDSSPPNSPGGPDIEMHVPEEGGPPPQRRPHETVTLHPHINGMSSLSFKFQFFILNLV